MLFFPHIGSGAKAFQCKSSLQKYDKSPSCTQTFKKSSSKQQTSPNQLEHFVLEETTIIYQLKLHFSVNKYFPLPRIPPKIC